MSTAERAPIRCAVPCWYIGSPKGERARFEVARRRARLREAREAVRQPKGESPRFQNQALGRDLRATGRPICPFVRTGSNAAQPARTGWVRVRAEF